jgi:hypothetical protein
MLDVPRAEAEYVIQPNSVADGLSGKPMKVVRVGWQCHSVTIVRFQRMLRAVVAVTMRYQAFDDEIVDQRYFLHGIYLGYDSCGILIRFGYRWAYDWGASDDVLSESACTKRAPGVWSTSAALDLR